MAALQDRRFLFEPIDPTPNSTTQGGGTSATGTPPEGNIPSTPSTPSSSPIPSFSSGCVQNVAEPVALTGTVQSEMNLPTSPTTGQVYKVMGGEANAYASYYVRWDGSAWEETFAPGLKNLIDPLTMPHALVHNVDGTFTFKPFCWKPRQIGDQVSNPAPAFVGRTIRDVFFYQNRLGFLSDENVIFSVAGDYGNFWRRTVIDYLDADVISVSATTTDVALMEYATPFNDGIMLFSGQRQFSLSNGQYGTTINSLEMNPVTDFTLTIGARPVPMGNACYFASQSGSYTSIQEYTRLDGRDAQGAAEVTSHVPGLLPSGVTQLIPMKSLDTVGVVMANSSAPQEMYIYQFFWDGNQKVISAWHRWNFGAGEVLSGAFADGQVSFIVRRDNTAYLEKMDLRSHAKSSNQDHLLYLDRQVTLTGTYNSGTGKTTFTFPYAPDPAKLRMIRTKTAAAPESIIPGSKVTVSGSTVTVIGDESAYPLTCGEVFKTAARLSQQFHQDYQGRNLDSGRLQLRSMSITSHETPFYTIQIQPYGPYANIDKASKTQTYNVSSQVLGKASFELGKPSYTTGGTAFMVGADASIVSITLINDTPYKSSWVSASWEGLYFNRTR